MDKLLLRMFYHPVLFFFALPLFYMALGVLFSIPYEAIRLWSILFFYLFILCNQMLENMLLRIPKNKAPFSNPFFYGLEAINLLIILYFGWQHSWTASLVLIGFSLIIQLQFLLDYYEMESVSAAISSLFNVFLLGGFAFYINTNFIHVQLLPIFTGLFFPFFLLEASRMGDQTKQKAVWFFLGLSYLVGILLLYAHVEWFSLVLLITLPFAWLVTQETNRQTTSTFALMFSFIYILLLAFSIL